MRNLNLTTPLEVTKDFQESQPPIKFGFLKPCKSFLSATLGERKAYVIGRHEDALIIDQNGPAEDITAGKVLISALKIMGWMTGVLPLIAAVGAAIFHAANKMIDKDDVPNTDSDRNILQYLRRQNPPLHLTLKQAKQLIEDGKEFMKQLKSENDLPGFLNKFINAEGKRYLVTSMMWYLMSLELAKTPKEGQTAGFTTGCFIIEDKEHKLYQVLNQLEGCYPRRCSHLLNWDDSKTRGFNVESGSRFALPGGKRHVLIKPIGNEELGERLFLKPESWGTSDPSTLRAMVHLGGHATDFIFAVFRLIGIGSNEKTGECKERIPETWVKRFKDVTKEVAGSKEAESVIGKGGRGLGIGAMYRFVDKAAAQNLTDEVKAGLATFKAELEKAYDRDTIIYRIGNEAIPKIPA